MICKNKLFQISTTLILVVLLTSTGTSATTYDYSATWSEIGSQVMPPATVDGVMVHDISNDVVVLFGGISGENTSNDVWVYDYKDSIWTQHNLEGPAARYGHVMEYIPSLNIIIMFGGIGLEENYLHDTWYLNISSLSWIEISTDTTPELTAFADTVYVEEYDQLYYFGGSNGTDYSSNMWSFDIASFQWIERSLSMEPVGRMKHVMEYDPSSKMIIVYGGLNAEELRDTWIFDVQEQEWFEVSNGKIPHSFEHYSWSDDVSAAFNIELGAVFFVNDNNIWMFNTMTFDWEFVSYWSGDWSLLKYGKQFTYISSINSFFSFGGVQGYTEILDNQYLIKVTVEVIEDIVKDNGSTQISQNEPNLNLVGESTGNQLIFVDGSMKYIVGILFLGVLISRIRYLE